MNGITINTTIIFSCGAVLGSLATILIQHYLSKGRAKEEREINGFNQAAKKFRSSILDYLLYVSFNNSKNSNI